MRWPPLLRCGMKCYVFGNRNSTQGHTAMTFLTETPRQSAPAVVGTLRSIGAAVASAVRVFAESQSRMIEVERLNAKSDADLAKMNLKREDIVRHVFRDLFGF